MRRRRVTILAWMVLLAATGWIVAHAHYTADLSAFLPARPSPAQQALVDELREGVAARLILIAINGGERAQRAQLSQALATGLRADPAFVSVNNGRNAASESDQRYIFDHRYLLSEQITADHFTTAGLRSAVSESIDSLASPAGFLAQDLLLTDPTGETLQVMGQLSPDTGPRSQDGVWVSADGSQALLVARTRVAGGDTNGQERALGVIEAEFGRLRAAAMPAARAVSLRVSGPGVFAIHARATIIREAIRLSVLSSLLIATLLLLAYRSLRTLALGLLPVVSGALAGAAAVALGFGVIHGVTLGFGVTLIGESVDYSIYLLIQARRGPDGNAAATWITSFWPTVRLGLFTSLCGFASLLPSAFPGLAQLGLYSMAGLLAAAAVTRYVLPALLPERWTARPLNALGRGLARGIDRLQRYRQLLWLLPLLAIAEVQTHRSGLWNRDLAALSPVSAADQAFDAQLRSSLGAPDVSDLIVITAADTESALSAAEAVGKRLNSLVKSGELAGFDTPARYLPSLALQRQRLDALPAGDVLRTRLRAALAGLPLRATRLEPFVAAVERARTALLVDRSGLAGTSLASGVDTLLAQRGNRVVALLPLRAPAAGSHPFAIDAAHVNAALGAAPPGVTIALLDLKHESDALYAAYQSAAIRLSLLGFGLIVLLLLLTLRSVARVMRVIAPLILSVLVVTAALAASRQALTILHLIGLLLIVAVGSNYALFFERHFAPAAAGERSTMLASLLIANLATVLGFGVLAFSTVPVLSALGMTVAPGAFAALLFSALMARPQASHGVLS
ncbi:MAG TPA: MMPL family transporter [Steroidobacteraceae bacterium]|nr:MMPL family transporter [Steroidobacteraceae bacterium]